VFSLFRMMPTQHPSLAPTKVIFLDFDGVIRIPVPGGGPRIEAEFCAERMKRVVRLAETSGARIVISSDWRLRHDRVAVEKLLSPRIPAPLLHGDWRTPLLVPGESGSDESERVPRGSEIVAWLASHPEIDAFAILDDAPSRQFPSLSDQLVRCTLLDGFTAECFEAALKALGASESATA